jgi:hypothetical protein
LFKDSEISAIDFLDDDFQNDVTGMLPGTPKALGHLLRVIHQVSSASAMLRSGLAC